MEEEATNCKREKYQVAAVVPSEALWEIVGHAHDRTSSDAARLILESIQDVGVSHGLKACEIPQRVVLDCTDTAPWTAASGLLTSLGKPCRPRLINRFRQEMGGAVILISTWLPSQRSARSESHSDVVYLLHEPITYTSSVHEILICRIRWCARLACGSRVSVNYRCPARV